MYFETGQGSALSAGAHHGVDQQTCEARAYAVARAFTPLLTNTVVGFIGPEYLYDGKQIIRAGLEDHFCGKLLGLPMGCDVCYTNHAEADSDDMDSLMTLLGAAGVTFIMGVPGADDIMLNYQSTSFHDALYLREVLGLKRTPEFEAWLRRIGMTDGAGRLLPANRPPPARRHRTSCRPDRIRDEPHQPTRSVDRTARAHRCAHRARPQRREPADRREVLRFGVAHAQARDAVHLRFDAAALRTELVAQGFETLEVESAAADRATYLHRPDLGPPAVGALPPAARRRRAAAAARRAAICCASSATGCRRRRCIATPSPLLLELRPRLEDAGLRLGPVVLAHQARVALGDEIGAALHARAVLMLIGERPGLSSPDSLGAYLTWAPRVGRSDAERNCVSNIRPEGLVYAEAARKLAWLVVAATRLGATGVGLKDDSDTGAAYLR